MYYLGINFLFKIIKITNVNQEKIISIGRIVSVIGMTVLVALIVTSMCTINAIFIFKKKGQKENLSFLAFYLENFRNVMLFLKPYGIINKEKYSIQF